MNVGLDDRLSVSTCRHTLRVSAREGSEWKVTGAAACLYASDTEAQTDPRRTLGAATEAKNNSTSSQAKHAQEHAPRFGSEALPESEKQPPLR